MHIVHPGIIAITVPKRRDLFRLGPEAVVLCRKIFFGEGRSALKMGTAPQKFGAENLHETIIFALDAVTFPVLRYLYIGENAKERNMCNE